MAGAFYYGSIEKAFVEYFEIPLRTVEDWEAGRRKPPEYIPRLLDYRIRIEFEKIVGLTASTEINDKRNVNVVIDTEGNKKEKHKKDAAFGWYRYESRFALPVYGQDNEIYL